MVCAVPVELREASELLGVSASTFRRWRRRYEELARMRCADFDGEAGTVLVRRAKSGKARQVVLNDEGAEFFEAHTAGRPDDALIFTHADGCPWGKSHQARLARITVLARAIRAHRKSRID